jgi:hypothetical protein
MRGLNKVAFSLGGGETCRADEHSPFPLAVSLRITKPQHQVTRTKIRCRLLFVFVETFLFRSGLVMFGHLAVRMYF